MVELLVRTLETMPEDATHWSTRSMAAACGLSPATVQRIWHAFGLKPHRTESFGLSSDPEFAEKMRDIVGLYLGPPDRVLVPCVDEKTEMQAIERTQPVLPMVESGAFDGPAGAVHLGLHPVRHLVPLCRVRRGREPCRPRRHPSGAEQRRCSGAEGPMVIGCRCRRGTARRSSARSWRRSMPPPRRPGSTRMWSWTLASVPPISSIHKAPSARDRLVQQPVRSGAPHPPALHTDREFLARPSRAVAARSCEHILTVLSALVPASIAVLS
jgi:hypothetical protein